MREQNYYKKGIVCLKMIFNEVLPFCGSWHGLVRIKLETVLRKYFKNFIEKFDCGGKNKRADFVL